MLIIFHYLCPTI